MSGEAYKDNFRTPDKLMEFAGIREGHTVLDICTGFGYLAKHVARRTKASVDAHNGSEWKGFFESVGIRQAIVEMEKQSVQHHWARLEEPALGKVDHYDLCVMQNTFHDLFDMPVDRSKFFASIRTALKKDGRFLLVDHCAGKGRGSKDAGANRGLHRIEESVAVAELEANGFEVEKRSDMFSYAGDDYKTSAWMNPMKRTDRFVLLCKLK